jgi:hypothetical protein
MVGGRSRRAIRHAPQPRCGKLRIYGETPLGRPGQNGAVDRKEREAILGDWGVRDQSLIESAEGRALERDLEGSPLRGRALPRRPTLRPAADSYVASLGGPLPYMVRLRKIEAETAWHERELEEAWRNLAEELGGDAERFARRWRRAAARWNLYAVNELIERHNRWYPVESRLPMDVRSGDFVLVNGESYRREPLDEAWVLERFPASLAAATAERAP